MRFNEAELIEFALGPGDQEGRMYYKHPEKALVNSAFKERWFKLKKNLLFYYRLNESGVVDKEEPRGVFVLENMVVAEEKYPDPSRMAFSITWKDEPFKQHWFCTLNLKIRNAWIAKIYRASYESLQNQVMLLRQHVLEKTGKDPLEQFGIPPKNSCKAPYHPIKRQVETSHPRSTFYSSPSSSSSTSDLQDPPKKSDNLGVTHRIIPNSAPSSPVLRPTFTGSPVPPPRLNRDRRKKEGSEQNHSRVSSFRSHLRKSEEFLYKKSSFKSHIKDISHLL